ncbi:MAG: DUF2238 domain-containing protein [Pseudomonadaceae bacterium]|nr:DUF2238 domain-containing protein [Pseudomonadaceae bacterium]
MRPARSVLLGLCGALVSGVWLWAAIAPLSRQDWLLENLLVFAIVALLLATRRRFVFSPLSYALLSLFLALHLYGSHYTYSETPFGFWLAEQLGLDRNHYDRIVHFAFGVLYEGHSLLRTCAYLAQLGARRVHSAVLVDRCVASQPIHADIVGIRLQVAPLDIVECHVPPYEADFSIRLVRHGQRA